MRGKKDIRAISTSLAPIPGGHYVQGIQYGNLLFIAGQLPILPNGTHMITAPFETQCQQALENLFGVLAGAGSSRECVVKVTAYIASADRWGAFNGVFAEMFGDHRPARTVVPVTELHHGYLVEIDAIAVNRSSGTHP
jgi:reactive intermediate/imine deaminase